MFLRCEPQKTLVEEIIVPLLTTYKKLFKYCFYVCTYACTYNIYHIPFRKATHLINPIKAVQSKIHG